ncbi:MAG: acryloyl-CoA reductase [Chloroflexi bacterium]|nr:acryloyl-CoA reductase [Chloroflexota bacterium]
MFRDGRVGVIARRCWTIPACFVNPGHRFATFRCAGRRSASVRAVTAIPRSFRAYIAEKVDDRVERGVRSLAASDLPPGEVEIRVEWSSVNYKDGLATRADGKVARISPLIPGIDLAGKVVSSADPALAVGATVLAHGYDLGVARHGGYSEFQRVPAGWVVPLDASLDPREAMAIGTAGFTAAMSVIALEDRGLRPGDGPVLVTGASGGVGSTAVAILAQRGHEVWAATGKPDEEARLRTLGATGVLSRDDVTASGKPLESERWAGAVDAVGAATLPYVLRTLRTGAAVASSGNASGPKLETTVFPFILRGVALLGMDSAQMAIERRRAIWARLADDLRPRGTGDAVTDVDLDTLDGALDAIVAGAARGRWVVRVSD